jgi:ATP-dependent DNA helicase DinG
MIKSFFKINHIVEIMLNDNLKQKIRTTLDELSSGIDGFNKRFSQNKMIAEVANTLSGSYPQHILCVEAPTGTGKTFAYLSSAITIAQELGVKLIVSSSNVALQEQLELKDIPDLQNITSLDFSATLVKGRSRYLCLRNLVQISEDSAGNNPLFSGGLSFDKPPADGEIEKLQNLLEAFETKRWNGEMDSLDEKVPFDTWNKINCNRYTCSSSRCDFYDDCVFFKARKKIHSSDVIIANHDLVLADIASGNTVLPDLNDSFIVFDEAHHLPQKALSHFAYSCTTDNIKNTGKNAMAIIKKIIDITKHGDITNFKDIDANVKSVEIFLESLDFDEETFIFQGGIVDENLLILTGNIAGSWSKLAGIFDDFKERFTDFIKISTVEKTIQEQLENAIGECEMHLGSILDALNNFNEIDKKDKAPQSRWVEKTPQGKNKYNYHLSSAKIDVAESLEKILWSRVRGCVLTSATLSSLDSFARLNTQLNLNDENTKYLRLPSPFDFKKVDFVIAKMDAEPTDNQNHTREVAEQILKRIGKNEGILVLFASNYQMQEVADLIEDKIDNLLVQGQFSKNKILEKHIQNRKNGLQSVILGLDSFAEGVDLKGDYLTQVMLAKLRFSMPNSPVEKTTADYLQSIGKNSFMEVSLPDVGLRLIQACGRLIRTETDTGTITIFDRRLVSKRYGKQLIDSLPDYNIVIE